MAAKWIICGASESAASSLPMVLAHHGDAVRIAVNAAIMLFPVGTLDYYLAYDGPACLAYHDAMLRHQSAGTKIMTLHCHPWQLRERRMEHADLLVHIANRSGQFRLGTYTFDNFAGLVALQFALNNGATDVHCVGMEGYRTNATRTYPDHYDGQPSFTEGERLTQEQIAPFTQSCIDGSPFVRFTFYGNLAYPIHGKNVTLTGETDHASAFLCAG